MEEMLLKILISLALGALIGIERERRMKESFAGFRTFMLVCSFGLISSYLSSIILNSLLILSFLFVGILAALNFYRKVIYKRGKGITTEIAFLLTFLIGVILYYESYPYIISLTLAFLLTLILVLKESLHEFAHKVTTKEIEDFIIFGLVAFVIYPILPDYPIDPFGILELKFIWKALVAIFGLSFFVYSIFRILKTKGIIWSSVLGGLINSIYISNFFSSNLKKFIAYPFLASVSSMLLRAYILSLIINPSLTIPNIFLLFTAISGFSISYLLSRKNKTTQININLTSPISFKFVTFYILLFSALFLIANIVSKYFGFFASQLLAAIVGLIDVSSLATIFSSFDLRNARVLLLILTSSNILGNSLVILKNNKKMFYLIFKYFCIIFLLNVFFFLLLS
jgi:uncharacterized membrane protein (DUF4010 family)